MNEAINAALEEELYSSNSNYTQDNFPKQVRFPICRKCGKTGHYENNCRVINYRAPVEMRNNVTNQNNFSRNIDNNWNRDRNMNRPQYQQKRGKNEHEIIS